MSLKKYEFELRNASESKSEGVYQRIADNFEDDLLEYQDFPRDYFYFLLKLLSDYDFYSKPGLWNFLLVLGTEGHKLESLHYEELADCIVGNYANYKNADLCLAVCDFIARNYSEVDAKAIFRKLEVIEANKPDEEKGFVKDGLRILAAEISRKE
ncbi:MAG: hypothetical protein HPY82_02995 [Gammaproteobacteria bacterium]|nr:hypothetical protein [Gammaproteobacteria bacterium]